MTSNNEAEVVPISLGKTLLVMVVMAALLNGSVYWLKRVGWVDGNAYQAVLAEYEQWKEGAIHENMSDDTKDKLYLEFKASSQNTFYSTNGYEKATKFAKEIVITLLLLVSLAILIYFKQYKYLPREITALLLLTIVLIMGFVSWISTGLLVSLAGLYSFAFLFIALFGGWLARPAYLGFFAICLLVLALAQIVLAPFELRLAYDAFTGGSELGDRLVGTHLQPSTAGIVAVITMVFVAKWGGQLAKRITIPVTSVLVFFSGSGAAMFLFLLGLIGLYPHRIPGARWLGVKFSVYVWIGVCFVLTPILVRRDVYASLFRRVQIFLEYSDSGLSVSQYLFGLGLGAGTNSALSLARYSDSTRDLSYPFLFSADSTVTMLIAQVGIVGCLLFYAMLVSAARRDTHSRAVYLVIGLASLTINIPEVYPINVLLGMLLAHSFMASLPDSHQEALRVST